MATPDLKIKDALLASAKSGSLDARNRLIKLHMPYARAIAKNFPHNGVIQSDFISIAYIAVVEAIDKMIESPTPYWSYIAVRIIGSIKDAIAANQILKTHYQTMIKGGVKRESSEIVVTITKTYQPETTMELAEVIAQITQSEFEQTILQLLIMGYSGKEVAAALDSTEVIISRTRSKICKKFCQLYGV